MRTFRLAAALAMASSIMLVLPSTAYADQTRDSQWYLDTLHVADAQRFAQGKDVTVGFIGGAVDAGHSDLADSIVSTRDFGQAEEDNAGQSGTGPASVLVGHGHGKNKGILGVAPDAKLALAFVDTGGNGAQRGAQIGGALQYLLEQHVDIVVVTVPAPSDNNGAIKEATNQAFRDNVPVVSASGETAGNVGGNEAFFPASTPHAIPAVGSTKQGKFWPESALPSSDGLGDKDRRLTLAAPATGIESARAHDKYGTDDGTAYSAAFVAGTFALVKSRWPDLGWDEIVSHVISTSSNGDKYDDHLGHGVVDPCKALGAEFGSHKTVGPKGKCVPSSGGDAAVGGPGATRDNTVLASAVGLVGTAGLAALVVVVRMRDRRGAGRRAEAAPTAAGFPSPSSTGEFPRINDPHTPPGGTPRP